MERLKLAKKKRIPIMSVEHKEASVLVNFGTIAQNDDDSDMDEPERTEIEGTQNESKSKEDYVCAGYLRKRGRHVKSWKKRWFVLTKDHFSYYKNSTDATPIKQFDVGDIANFCVIPPGEFNRYLLLLVETPRRTYLLKNVDDSGDMLMPWKRVGHSNSSMVLERWARFLAMVVSLKKGTQVDHHRSNSGSELQFLIN